MARLYKTKVVTAEEGRLKSVLTDLDQQCDEIALKSCL